MSSLTAAAGSGAAAATTAAASAPPAANIRVYVRVRPLNARESESCASAPPCLSVRASRSAIELHARPEGRLFAFDHVADAQASQEDVFEKVGKPITDACLAGYNGTIFAYGQTGSGKTFTIQGINDPAPSSTGVAAPNHLRGLMPRVFEYLTAQIAREEAKARPNGAKMTFNLSASFLEIYNERCYDLLEGTSPVLALREDTKRGVYVEGLVETPVRTARDLSAVMEKGIVSRRVGETAMNRESSRSHCVFTLHLSSTLRSPNGASTTKHARFNLIDLAGSERAKSTQATGARMDEAKNINRSLSALGNVIRELMKKSTGANGAATGEASIGTSSSASSALHIPYRDSKLTFLLRDSLGGNSLTMLVACVSSAASAFFESMSTLKFAAMANTIRNNAKINAEEEREALIISAAQAARETALKDENEKLKQQVQRMLAQQGLGNRRLSLMPGLMAMGANSSNNSMGPGLVTPSKLMMGSIAESPEQSPATSIIAEENEVATAPAAAASSASELHLHTMLVQSHSRESEWAREIESYKAQIALLEKKQLQDGFVLRLREKHIESLRKNNKAAEDTSVDQVLREENAHLIAELDALKHSASQLTHVPNIIAAHEQIRILMDKLQDAGVAIPGFSTSAAPRHHVAFEQEARLRSLVEQHSELSAAFDALRDRSPEDLLAELTPEQRRSLVSFEIESWKATEEFETRMRAKDEQLQSERDMVAHLEQQLQHALDSGASERREAAEAMLLKNGFVLRLEAEKSSLAKEVASLEAQRVQQHEALLAAQTGQALEVSEISARLLGEIESWKAKLSAANTERSAVEQQLFESSQKAALLAHQNENIAADLAASTKNLEESKAARLQESAAHKASIVALEQSVASAQAQIASLSSDLSISTAAVAGKSVSLDAAQSEVSSLTAQVESLRDDLDSAMFKLESVQEDIDTLNTQFGFQADQLAQEQNKVAELTAKIAEQDSAIEQMHTQLHAKEEALVAVKIELATAQAANNYESEFLALQAQNAEHVDTLATNAVQIQTLETQVAKLESDAVVAVKEREALTLAKEAAERSITELTAAIQDYSSRLSSTTESFTSTSTSLTSAQELIAGLEAQNGRLEDEVSSQRAEVERYNDEIVEVQSELSHVRADLSAALSSQAEVQAALSAAQASHAAVEANLASVQASEAESQQQLQSARAELSSTRDALSASEEALLSVTAQKRDVEGQLSALLDRASQLETGAAETVQHLQASAAAAMDTVRAECATLRAQLDSSVAEVTRVREASSAARREFEAKNAQFASMLAAFESHKKTRDEEIVSLRTQVAHSEAGLNQARQEAHKSAAEVAELDAKIRSLTHEAARAAADAVSARQEAQLASQDSAIALTLQSEVSALQERVESLMSERHTWLQELESARADEAASLSTHASLSAQLSAAQESAATATDALTAAQAQLALLSEQNAALTGHQNQRQKIQLHMQIKKENETLKAEKASLERELRKCRKVMATNGTAHSAAAGGGSSAAGLERDLQLADEHIHQGEQAQVQLKALITLVAKLDEKVRVSAATHQAQAAPLGDITNRAGAAVIHAGDVAVKSAVGADVASDAFPSCLQSLSSLSAQLCSAHAQLELQRRELATARNQQRLQSMKEQMNKTHHANSSSTAISADGVEEQENA